MLTNIGEGSIIILLESVLICARLLDNRSHSTIAKHLLILSKLLTMKEPSIDSPQRNSYSPSEHLLCYVIATCYPKMKRRSKHRTLSLPYIKSLEEITTFQFDESKLNLASNAESANDLLFMRKFMLPFLRNIGTKIPKLTMQANALDEGKPVYLYTEDTCAEFHTLFLELLRNFLTSLDVLEKARGDPEGLTKGSEKFEGAVGNVMFSGYALEKLAKGAALQMHLQTIAHLLRAWNIGAQTPVPAPEEEQEEPDEELKAVQPFVSIEGNQTPLWKSYGDWLGLLVAHFDAVDILVGYITGPEFQHSTISIQILVAPPMDQDLLPWRELFTDSTLFPTETVWDPPSDKPNAAITNADIHKFLNKAVAPSSKAQTLKKQWSGKRLDSTMKSLEDLKSSNLPGWGEYATKLLAKLQGFKDPPESGSAMYHEISEDIQALLESTKFFASLDDTPGFSGTLHCEACLASLLDKNATVSKAILDQMEVGYISNLFLSSESHFF